MGFIYFVKLDHMPRFKHIFSKGEVQKKVWFLSLLLTCPLIASAHQNVLSASVFDAGCRNFGNWESKPYLELQAKIIAQARCFSGSVPELNYIHVLF
jgi:hypothetical protein